MKTKASPRNHESPSSDQELNAIDDMAKIRSTQQERSHNRLNDFNRIEKHNDPVPFKDNAVRIGVLDNDGMHTVEAHSPEEAAQALAAAYGWDGIQDLEMPPSAVETDAHSIPHEQELQELLDSEEWNEWVRDQRSGRGSIDAFDLDEPFDGDDFER